MEIGAIDRLLSELIGPFVQLSEENRLLALELKRRQGDEFRTLVALLTPGWRESLSVGEANLLDAVVANGVELRELLTSKGAAMFSPALVPYLSRASTHFRFLDLAYRGSLDPDPDRYTVYTYPRELDAIIEAERRRLEERHELLRRKPHRTHARMSDLQFQAAPSDLRDPSVSPGRR